MIRINDRSKGHPNQAKGTWYILRSPEDVVLEGESWRPAVPPLTAPYDLKLGELGVERYEGPRGRNWNWRTVLRWVILERGQPVLRNRNFEEGERAWEEARKMLNRVKR